MFTEPLGLLSHDCYQHVGSNAKLVELTRKKELGGQYGYKLGAFILFNDKKPSYTWFEGGTEVK